MSTFYFFTKIHSLQILFANVHTCVHCGPHFYSSAVGLHVVKVCTACGGLDKESGALIVALLLLLLLLLNSRRLPLRRRWAKGTALRWRSKLQSLLFFLQMRADLERRKEQLGKSRLFVKHFVCVWSLPPLILLFMCFLPQLPSLCLPGTTSYCCLTTLLNLTLCRKHPLCFSTFWSSLLKILAWSIE